jgi:ankyrin repeat protein
MPADSEAEADDDDEEEEKHSDKRPSQQQEEDDPGTDHAVDPQSPPAVAWKPQNQQTTCEFTHTITNYAQKRESGCKKAEYSEITIDEFGNRWRLIIYVNGNGRASNHHLSLFLQVADAEELPFGWKKAVSYVLTLEHPNGGNLGYSKRNPDKTFKLCPKAIDWGWSQFITSDRIQQEGFVSNDSLTVRASVTVKSSSISIDMEDAELYLKSAVEDGNADAVETCLAQGASVSCQFKDDLYTPLHTACSSTTNSGSLNVLNLLLERGADPNACNKWKETPLLIAANNGHCDAVKALLENGADSALCSEAGWSALTFAAHKGYADICALLLKAGAPVNVRVTEDLSTPLHKACAGGKPGHLSAVQQLLENGADVHALNKWRETPLLTAANHGQAEAVEALLKHGADPCKCTDTGWSPLSIAAYKGHDKVVKLLLEEGAPTEEADPTLSALLQAATKGLPDTVELLLRHGADHTVTTKKGDTALSILVEQNLIDAAAEMVTEYKASIPRCSRDRKKVQRARLLINLRLKQMQREGLINLSSDDDEETDDETDESNLPSNADTSSPPNKKKEKKDKKGSLESAEAQARAAEEALLLELEQEESKAMKEEAAANSKRAKKKKKKERDRQQKLREEQEQREKEEKEAEERERQRQLREEKERKEREERLKDQREQEAKEAEELDRRAREAAARRREKDETERQKRDQERKERERLAVEKAEADAKAKTSMQDLLPKNSRASGRKVAAEEGYQNGQYPHQEPAQQGGRRGWETKNGATPVFASTQSFSARNQSPPAIDGLPSPVPSRSPSSNNNRSANFAVFDARPQPAPPMSPVRDGSLGFVGVTSGSPMKHQQQKAYYELPQVVLFRQEKLGQIFQRCALARTQPQSEALGTVSEDIIKGVVYRWIVRAAHENSPFLDCMIPSWTDFDSLSLFLQRQFISESRKTSAGLVNMESMKEAGASFAHLCHTLAKDLVQFRQQQEEKIPANWTDVTFGLRGTEVMRNGLGSMVCIDWDNRAQVFFTSESFTKATERHAGSSRRLLTALFAARKRYEILGMLVSGTSMDHRLMPSTKIALSREAHVNVELWTDPFSVSGSNSFFGCFDDIDSALGGFPPFGKSDKISELSMLKRGGSVAVMPPLDSTVASLYLRRIVDLLDSADKEGIPLSFCVFLHSECLRDSSHAPTVNDAISLDPRLGEHHRGYLRCAEPLLAGQHAFQSGKGEDSAEISRTGSLFVLLQNEAGRVRLPMTESSVVSIIRSMRTIVLSTDSPFAQNIGYSEGYVAPHPVPASPAGYDPVTAARSPVHQIQATRQPDYGSSGGPSITAAFSNSPGDPDGGGIGIRPRRGRLFDLIDDGEFDNNAEVVSGVLQNLDASLFKDPSSQDIDIEAIGLGFLGIGSPSAGGGPAPDNARTTSRFVG